MAAGSGGAIVAMRFAEAGWMVFPLERAVWEQRDQERGVMVVGRTRAVMRKGAELRKVGAVRASEGLGRSRGI